MWGTTRTLEVFGTAIWLAFIVEFAIWLAVEPTMTAPLGVRRAGVTGAAVGEDRTDTLVEADRTRSTTSMTGDRRSS